MTRTSKWLAVGAATALACACVPSGFDEAARPDPGNPVPDFRAPSLEGDTVSLASLQGRPVVLNLWATWCAPCRTETPYLQSIFERFRSDGLQVVGLSVDTRNARTDVEEFVEEFGVSYLILHDPTMAALDVFAVLGLPATYLVDSEGIITWKRLGPIPDGDAEFEEAIRRALEG